MTLPPRTTWLQRIAFKRFQRLGREFFWISLGQAVAVLGGVVGVRILTELLDPQTYGQLALGMTVAAFVNKVALGSLGNGATRFFASARESGTLSSFLVALRRIVLTLTGGLILFFFLFGVGLVLTGQSNWMGLGIAAFCFALLSGYNSILNGIQNAARQRAVVALHQGGGSVGRFLVAAGLILWLGASSTVAMMGYGLAMFIVLSSQYIFFQRITNTDSGANVTKMMPSAYWRTQIIAYSWPFALWGIFTWAQEVSGRWALQIFSTTQNVGLYAVLYQLGAYPIVVITGLAISLLSPILFERAGDASDASRVRKVYAINWRLTGGVLGLTGVAALFAFSFHEFVFHLLVSPDYHAVSWLLPGVVLASGLFTAGQTLSLSIMSENRTSRLIFPKIGTAIVATILSLLGAAWYGVTGVVVASMVFSTSHFLWVAFLVIQSGRGIR